MNNNSTSLEMRLLSLLHRVREERDEAARADLNALLREEAEARKIMPRLLVDEQALVSQLRDESIVALIERDGKPRQTIVPLRFASRWLSWRPLTAAAAGVVFGLLCASVVWAMVVPGNKMQVRQLLSQGFEDTGLRLERGFPNAAGVWNGDRAQVARSESAAEGQHVVRFGPAGKRRFSYVNGMVDVTGLGRDGKRERAELRLTVNVRAVNGNQLAQRYTLRLAAFAEDAAAVKEQWFSGGEASERALGFASRVLDVNQDGWATLGTALPLPAGARHVVVSIGAATVDSTAPKVEHELDALRLELVTTREVLP
jgi:hypothetical protein